MTYATGQKVFLKHAGYAVEYVAPVNLNGELHHVIKSFYNGEQVWTFPDEDIQAEPIWCPKRGDFVATEEGRWGILSETGDNGNSWLPPHGNWYVMFEPGVSEPMDYFYLSQIESTSEIQEMFREVCQWMWNYNQHWNMPQPDSFNFLK